MEDSEEESILCMCGNKGQHANDEQQSFDSEDLIELSKYYEKQENYKCLKSEIQQAKKKLSKLPKTPRILKQLFRKTLDKLRKYKNDQ